MQLRSSGAGAAARRQPGAAIDLSGSVFRREGEYWTIAYDGVVFRLRDTKGLHCVASLLRRPGQKIAAADLMQTSGPQGDARGNGNQGPRTRNQRQDQGRGTPKHRPSPDERERVRITKRIRGAIAKIAAHHASLGHHLSTCIKTGSFCVYTPDPQRAPPWKL